MEHRLLANETVKLSAMIPENISTGVKVMLETGDNTKGNGVDQEETTMTDMQGVTTRGTSEMHDVVVVKTSDIAVVSMMTVHGGAAGAAAQREREMAAATLEQTEVVEVEEVTAHQGGGGEAAVAALVFVMAMIAGVIPVTTVIDMVVGDNVPLHKGPYS